MKFKMKIMSGNQNVFSLEGQSNPDIRMSEYRSILEVEAFLEKILGFRFHIEEA